MVTAGNPAVIIVIIQTCVVKNQSTLTPGDIKMNKGAGQEGMIYKTARTQ